MDNQLQAWRKEGKHLPKEMRDFHDQKDIFKAMHEMTGLTGTNPATGDNVNSVDGHIYVVDAFLWFMARHGYTLQKSRAHQNFDDLHTNVAACNQHRAEQFSMLLSNNQNTTEVKE